MYNILITLFFVMSFNWNKVNSKNYDSSINNEYPIKLNITTNTINNSENNNDIKFLNNTNKDNLMKFMNNNVIYNNNSSSSSSSNNNGNNEGSQRILSRKRRYLIFPEGSSFQVVWDGIVPIVDYNNYLILGITVALAWELPSKPPSEQIEDIREKLNNGTIGLQRNDTIDNIKYIDTSSNKKTNQFNYDYNSKSKISNSKMDGNKYKFHPPLTYNYDDRNENYYNRNKYVSNFNSYDNGYHHRRRPMYYTQLNYNNQSSSIENRPHQYYYNKYQKKKNYSNWNKFNNNNPWTKFANRITNSWRRNGQSKNSNYRKNNDEYRYRKNNEQRKHRIYPVFGKRKKRSTESVNFSPIEKFDLNHHRSTRHVLYEKIEKFLKAKDLNGIECVLKALCETGQREHEEEPTSFLGEIMRVIFTMPQSIDNVNHSKHKAYDEAHAHDGDCNEKYPLCDGSIWSPNFIV